VEREAILYRKLENDQVVCDLCAHRCRILPGRKGVCRVRINRGGELFSLVYGRLVAENVDPIEKKPLYHFQPGSLSYSIATAGCNMSCSHCQNYQISMEAPRMKPIPGEDRSPEEVVKRAYATGSSSIAYTYTEPAIFMEFAADCGEIARNTGISNVFVTNGYLTPEAVEVVQPFLDAANVDLKGATEEHYRSVCQASLQPVLETIEALYRAGTWVEVTTLLIPGLNDDTASLEFISGFLAGLDPLIPWHVSRFHPIYRMMDRDATPVESLHRALEVGTKQGLKYIYLGNVSGENVGTRCHECDHLLIDRSGFSVTRLDVTEDNCCPECETAFNGVMAESRPIEFSE
jgi:pyruvate formate lyase activating enzyme